MCLCVLRCLLREWLHENLRPQVGHGYGLSPVWVRWCLVSDLYRVNVAPHSLQMYFSDLMWTFCSCSFMLPSWENPLPHTGHRCGFSPEWISVCTFKSWREKKPFPQLTHLKGLSPVWLLMCLLSPSEREKRLSQRVQRNGFSPVWVRRCRRSSEALKKHIPQSVQLWGFSGCSSCVFSCSLQWPASEKPFPQTEHVKGFSPVCTLMWRTSLFSLLKVFMQYGHSWGTLGCFACVRLCLSNFEGLSKILPQSGHGCSWILLWQFMCRSSFSGWMKLFSQCWHWWVGLGCLLCTGSCLRSLDGRSNTLPQTEQG